VSSALLKITRPFSFFEPATSDGRLSEAAEAAELAPGELGPCELEPGEAELLQAAAAPIAATVAAVAARRGQWSLDISSSFGRLQICYSRLTSGVRIQRRTW
jgi:hypothetical protein